MKYSDLRRKIKYGIYIPRKITKKPSSHKNVISDLFCLRFNNDWGTRFEILNIAGLIQGDVSPAMSSDAEFNFFDTDGKLLGKKIVAVGNEARKSVFLDKEFFTEIDQASTFSVFHGDSAKSLDLGSSYLAERGYTGYKFNNSQIWGYVHGNLDAVANFDGNIEMLGNKGILNRFYQVQHPLRGNATYEFFLTNPCKKKVKVEFQQKVGSGKWEKIDKSWINPRGSKLCAVNVPQGTESFVRVKSKLYLGRPVVFRVTDSGFDVFHG